MSTRDDYIAKMKQQLDELAAQMSRLEAKAQEAKADARDKYREELVKLRQQSKFAKGKLNDFKTAGEDKWKPWSQRWKKFATLSNILGWYSRLLRWA
jgi:chromosome segregation ATPase